MMCHVMTDLHKERDEVGQHGEGVAEDVEECEGHKRLVCCQLVLWSVRVSVNEDKGGKSGQRYLEG